MSQEEVIKVLISKFQENGDSNLKNISPHTMISELGKDSLSLIELGFEIEKSLKIKCQWISKTLSLYISRHSNFANVFFKHFNQKSAKNYQKSMIFGS